MNETKRENQKSNYLRSCSSRWNSPQQYGRSLYRNVDRSYDGELQRSRGYTNKIYDTKANVIKPKSRRSCIQTLIRFNRKQIVGSQKDIIDTFVGIARQADPVEFNAQSLSMLFVGAKKYGIKYSDWQENSQ